MEYKLYLEETIYSMFYELERIQDGCTSHVVTWEGKNKKEVAKRICNDLIPFFEEQLEEVY